MNKIIINLYVFLLLLSINVHSAPQIELKNFWIASPPAVAKFTAGYGTIENNGDESDTLLSVSSELGSVMLHKTEIVSGRATMLHKESALIEAHDAFVLKPMSFHLMLNNLGKSSTTEKASLLLYFKFKKSGLIKINVPIRNAY